jgi:hypothetical protein
MVTGKQGGRVTGKQGGRVREKREAWFLGSRNEEFGVA